MLPALPPFRRRAQRFADALDGRGPAGDAQLAGLVQLAEALRRVPAGPAPEFTDQLRRRLVAVAAVQVEDAPVLAPVRSRGIPALRVRLATGAAAAVTLLTALSVGASTSLPGEALYGLKRAAEGAQLAVAGSDYQRGVRELQFAATRLHEVADLTGHGDVVGLGIAADFRPVAATTPTAGQRATAGRATSRHASDIVGALADMRTETAKGAQYLARDYQAHNDPKALTTLHTFTTRQYAGLRALLPDLPAAAVPAARASLGQLSGIDRIVYPVLRARGMCETGCAPTVPVVPSAGSVPPLGAPGDTTTGGGASGPGSVPGDSGAGGASSAPGGSSAGLGGLLGGLTGGSGSSTSPTPGAGSSSGSGSGGLPLPLPTSALPIPLPTSSLPLPLPLPTTVPPLPLPLPTTTLPLPLPSGGSSTSKPAPSASSAPAPGVTVCASPLVLVGGVCVTASLPPIIP